MSALKIQLANDSSILQILCFSFIIPIAIGFGVFYFSNNIVVSVILGFVSYGISLFIAIKLINKSSRKYIFEVRDGAIFHNDRKVVNLIDIEDLAYDFSTANAAGGASFYRNRNFRFLIVKPVNGLPRRLNLSSTSADVNDIIRRIKKEIMELKKEQI
ncbi:hypothetical protein [Flammeovirga sp. EKP202]|uniref:hypothetical protein n=1 Tax=Flammeovirga sp. EKP202 TaxID=2770592 RepID=UPI00165F2AB1|nr:hypothetical protein [Flammeovirga sp. EKP202]MBD0403644.1 hypothetical protein [Flammeovirga sp. EKP202]